MNEKITNKITDDHPFVKELETLINMHSMENGSNTPDFILANYLKDCLVAYNNAYALKQVYFYPI